MEKDRTKIIAEALDKIIEAVCDSVADGVDVEFDIHFDVSVCETESKKDEVN